MTNNFLKADFANPFIQSITKHTNEVIIILDSEFKILLFNSVAENIFNCSANAILGKKLDMVMSRLNIEDFSQHKQAILANPTGYKLYTTHHNMKLSWSVFHVQVDNSLFLLLKAIIIEEKSEQDDIIRLETLLENMPCNVYWMDKNCTMVGCNQNVLSMLNMTREEYIGKTYEELAEICHWPKDLAEKLKNDDLQVLRTGQPIFGIEDPPLPHANNTSLNLLTSRVPIRNNLGEIIGVAGISVDISELKRARESAEAANQAKTEFIANMSHDIRTPLNGVIGVAELLRKVGSSPKDREYGQMIYVASKELLELLNSILDVVSADHMNENDIYYETFSLQNLLNHLCELMQASLKAKNIQLKLMLDPALPDYVVNDRLKLERILQNLLGNAIKFTSQGSVTIIANVIAQDKESVQIEFCISDTGIGIPENQKQQIFERFFRATPSYEGIYQGHGVGLYIVKKFVNLLGGEILVDSEPGKGTRFRFMLSMKVGKSQDAIVLQHDLKLRVQEAIISKPIPIQTQELAQDTSEPADKTKILFIEDNEIARYTGQVLLQNAGYRVQAVETAENAMALVKSQAFDLIISDLGLPGIQGDEMANIIRYWEKIADKTPTPIIALTAHADHKVKNNCLLAGINEIFIKPLDEKLLQTILQWLLVKKDVEPQTNIKSDAMVTGLGPDLPLTEEALFQLNNYALFDETDGVKKIGSKKALREMLMLLLERVIPEELAGIKVAHVTHNWQEVQRIAHKLKGGAVYCGTIRMAYACQYLERYRQAGHDKLLEELYQQLLLVIMQTQQVIKAWLIDVA